MQVRFALDDAGTVLLAEVLQSSGNRRTDDAALGSIRAASFPRPPASLAPEQLVYIVPFDFR